MNLFDEPKKYLNYINNVKIPKNIIDIKKEEYSGKTMLCAWLTKLCPAKCLSCFFKSNMYKESLVKELYELSDIGVEKLIKFVNESNNSYLMLSGGGEPMIKHKEVNKIIRNVKTDRIVIVTSGIWANTYENALKYINELYQSTISRNDDAVIVVRLSIDYFHYTSPSITIKNYENIINVFKNKYNDNEKFILRIHTMQDDNTLEKVCEYLGAKLTYDNKNGITDNSEVIKIVPKKAIVTFDDGYSIFVGLSKLFLSNIKVNINEMNNNIYKALEVFEKDMKISEYGNPSIITNCNGLQGIDLWSDYNGNITAWGCQQPDNLHSIYVDSYKKLVNDTLKNIGSYSFLDKGYYYRRNIIKTVNPRAVLRSEAINLRDYAGAFLIEEDNTRLYYNVCAIKDYLDENILSDEDLVDIPSELFELIHKEKKDIDEMYRHANYDILKQYMLNKNRYTKEDWDDLFLLIGYGHYDIHKDSLKDAIKYYNEKYNQNINNIYDVKDMNNDAQLARLHNRISPMQDEAYKLCLKNVNKL